MEDGFHIMGVSAFEYTLVLGLAILAAMILNVQVERRRGVGGGRGTFARLLLRAGGTRRRQETRP